MDDLRKMASWNEEVPAGTPRTDEAAIGFARIVVDREKWTTTELVEANFARQLEREIMTLRLKLKYVLENCDCKEIV